MQVIIAAMLSIVGTIALLFAGLMLIGLLVAQSDAGARANVWSFWQVIIPNVVVSVVCFAGAFGVMIGRH